MHIIAQIGCGYWGPNLLRNFSAQPDTWVKWVAELSPQRRQYVEKAYPKTKTVEQWEVILNDADVSALVITTPASSHYQLVKTALKEGKHVLVEKPLAMTTQEAEELATLAEKQRKILMVGHTFLYNAAVRYLKNLVDDGDVGETYYLYSQRLNLGQVRADVNTWWNLAPHDISILMYLMNGKCPTSVVAHGIDYIQPGIEDVVFATLTWENRVTAHIHVSWLNPDRVRKLTLVGSRKMVVYDDASDDKIRIVDKGIDRVPKAGETMHYDRFDQYQLFHRAGDAWLPRIQFQEPLKVEVQHFLECIEKGTQPLTDGRHGRDVVSVLEAGQIALNTGQSVNPKNLEV